MIFELSVPGARGVLPPLAEPEVTALVGDPAAELPAGIGRPKPPALPELSQLHVLRHYARLSQENLGVDLNIDVGQGTCTMKYSPKVNDQLVRNPKLAEASPLMAATTKMNEVLAKVAVGYMLYFVAFMLFRAEWFVEMTGFLSAGVEACLPLPQFLSNLRRHSVEGLR
mgnify:CR=1 FL=1